MKKYVIDFVVGLVFGLLFFLGAPLVFGKNPLYLDFQYHLLAILFYFIFAITPYFRNRLKENTNKKAFLVKTFLMFVLGFFLPALTWFFIVYKAASNFLN